MYRYSRQLAPYPTFPDAEARLRLREPTEVAVSKSGKPTLQTVADHVGVSRMTVSNAYSRPDQLSSSLRQRILDAAAELGYLGPDPAARALKRGSAKVVGIILPRSLRSAFTEGVISTFLGAVAEELAPTGLAITLFGASSDAATVSVRDVAVDGALVCSADASGVAWLEQRGAPLVFVDQDAQPGHSSVNVDDHGGALAASRHIVDLGHRRVGIMLGGSGGQAGIVADPSSLPPGHILKERLRGWLEPLSAVGVTPMLAASQGNGYGVAREMLSRDDRPTAVLCFSDTRAHEVAAAADDLGLRVPEDLSIVGFDDSPMARSMRPGLTTVRQDVEEKGRSAAAALRLAIEAASHQGTAPMRQHLLPVELVVRGSTGAA